MVASPVNKTLSFFCFRSSIRRWSRIDALLAASCFISPIWSTSLHVPFIPILSRSYACHSVTFIPLRFPFHFIQSILRCCGHLFHHSLSSSCLTLLPYTPFRHSLPFHDPVYHRARYVSHSVPSHPPAFTSFTSSSLSCPVVIPWYIQITML